MIRSNINKRRSNKSMTYVHLMNFKCSNPECDNCYNIEGHHIVPMGKGGVDAFWNIIALCRKCHRGLRLHSNFSAVDTELYTWKCMHELNRFGFYLDEKEPDFHDKLKRAVLIAHSETLRDNIERHFPLITK
jgi:hypothetical protein